ncbi:ferredoxin [Solirubrobacter phytolaccae]|uniref:Ferredoxin n=1 Tax=Solirubrobacter phytolaccae TaxID=1404360 RepID=A0A9X3S9X9_9ACTN|nr:ferredoxin [Solirubrobacter phytolaccae]MDA0179720.1 ferredoxin [Solirubrobacter phytolaccae]
MTLIAQIDDAACLGHGDCVHVAPTVFILEGDVAEQQAPGTDDQLRQAARACPAGAIILLDAQSGDEVNP